jgi:hypothetical protein
VYTTQFFPGSGNWATPSPNQKKLSIYYYFIKTIPLYPLASQHRQLLKTLMPRIPPYILQMLHPIILSVLEQLRCHLALLETHTHTELFGAFEVELAHRAEMLRVYLVYDGVDFAVCAGCGLEVER